MNLKKIINNRLLNSFFAVSITLLLSFGVTAQSGTSSIKGTVQDGQGQVIPGAKVTLKNDGRNISLTRITNSDGQFSFVSLQPDSYKIEVEATNFKKSLVTVQALVDSVAVQAIQLEAGSINEIVEISTSDEANLNTTSGESVRRLIIDRFKTFRFPPEIQQLFFHSNQELHKVAR